MKLIKRYQPFIKFGFVAIGYNVAAYLMYVTLIYFKCNYLMASAVSFFLGVALSYFMNKSIVFAIKQHSHTLVFRYLAFYLALLAVNLVLLHGFVSLLKINPYWAQIFVTALAAFISYNTMRVFVFRRT
jgi:putative flippase GtrA